MIDRHPLFTLKDKPGHLSSILWMSMCHQVNKRENETSPKHDVRIQTATATSVAGVPEVVS